MVPGAVEPLVVGACDLGDVAERADSREDFHRPAGMAPNHVALVWVEWTGLVEDPARHAELADVVEQRGSRQGGLSRSVGDPVARRARARSRPPLRADGGRCKATWRRRSTRTRAQPDPAARRRRQGRGRPARSGATAGVWSGPLSEALVVFDRDERIDQGRDRTRQGRRRRATAQAAPAPPRCQNTSAVCARHNITP